MGCRSDYMEPREREKQSLLVINYLNYLFTVLGKSIPHHIKENIDSSYGNIETLDADTALLCSTIRNLSEQQLESLVYNGRNKTARHLADWWDDHQEKDHKRHLAEQEQQRKIQLKQQALSKLTLEELQAILKT